MTGGAGATRVAVADGFEKRKKPKKDPRDKKPYEAGGIVVFQGKVVVRLSDEQRWIFPKGKRRKKEDPLAAALREVAEETGLVAEPAGGVGEFIDLIDGKFRRVVFYVMVATGTTFDHDRRNGRDTFLIPWESVDNVVRRRGYADVWRQCRERVIELCARSAAEQPALATV